MMMMMMMIIIIIKVLGLFNNTLSGMLWMTSGKECRKEVSWPTVIVGLTGRKKQNKTACHRSGRKSRRRPPECEVEWVATGMRVTTKWGYIFLFLSQLTVTKLNAFFYSHTQSEPEGCSGDFRHLLWRRISSAIMQQYNCLPKPHRPRNPMPLHLLSCCDYPVASTSRTASLQFMLSISHP